MPKKIQRPDMADAYVTDAAECARVLVQSRRPFFDDWEDAARRTASDIGVDYWTLWGLRFRKPKRIYADAYAKIRSAYEAEEAQRRAAEERRSARLDDERARLRRLRDALSEIDPEFHAYEIGSLNRAIQSLDSDDQAAGAR